MAPSKPTPSSSAAGPKPSLGRPRIFGGGTRRSTRIEKKSALENDRTQKQNQGSKEAEPEETVQPQRARPEPQFTETQSSRRSKRKALPSDRCLRSTRAPQSTTAGATNRDGENESRKPPLYHTISEGGPRLKNIGELIVDTDRYENFRIPSNYIIANEDVDTMVYEQMRRLAKDGNLTPERVRGHLVRSVKEFEECWGKRRKSPTKFWELACEYAPGTPGTWMNQLDGADCREFFLWLLTYFRHGSGRGGTNEFIRAFERLDQLFEEEEKTKKSELDELDGVRRRLRAPANRSPGPSHGRAAAGRGAASKKSGNKDATEDGNILRWSGRTNMSDFELSGIDVAGLIPIVDVGGAREKREEWKRRFDEELKADKERIRQEEEAGRAAGEQAAAQEAAAQGRRRRSRKPPTPPEMDSLMPDMNQQNAAKAGRKFAEFEEDEEEDDWEEQERLRAAALKRQKLLERHAARGGPKSD